MKKIIIQFLSELSWHFEVNEDQNIVYFDINGKNGDFTCIIYFDEIERLILIISICNEKFPKEKQNLLLELINLINYELFLGNFEINIEEGEIRLRTSAFYQNIEFTSKILGELLMPNIYLMDRCLPLFTGVIYEKLSIQNAIEKFNSSE